MDTNSNLQKLEEFVCDEDKIVTVPWLCTTLAITAKDAKDLINEYISHSQKSQPGNLSVLYLLSGLREDTLTISITKEDELDDKKDLYTTEPIVEVYSIQKSKDVDLNTVALVDCFNSNNPRSTPILGSVISKNCVKRNFKSKKPLPLLPAPIIKEKSSFFTKLPPKSTNNNSSTAKPSTTKVASSPKQTAFNRFFSNNDNNTVKKEAVIPASKPVTDTKNESKKNLAIVDTDSDSEPQKKIVESTNEKKRTKRSTKKKESSAKRRKRIVVEEDSDQDIFATDDDEEETSRKRKNVITDSDEEVPVVKEEPLPDLPKNKKRRLVDRTFEDEEGFIITKKEWVQEDASEDETQKVVEMKSEPEVKKEINTNEVKTKQNKSPKNEKSVNGKLSVSLNMDLDRTCICIVDDVPLLDLSSSVEIEEAEEIDEDELVKDTPVPHNIIWQQICDEFDSKRQEAYDFLKSKQTRCEVTQNFALQLFEDCFSNLLIEILVATLNKAKALSCIKYQKDTFNGIDYIAEMLWNKNPKHPERKDNWTYIFDMDWVKLHLITNPRPYYPLSWVWTPDVGSTKVKAFIKGCIVRLMPEVQEMRQFWIIIKNENKVVSEVNSIDD
ncbi:hypothetical protein RN001_008328 [Aquatica leii]|uniref:DNA polymerase delta subunit 3 n=1 Tax=Aquatica leii TaxID=1421715 RepID=A0AAN7P9H8_9COLE|nr:hypothetical protein RN001_008328 [Aquatica leii]